MSRSVEVHVLLPRQQPTVGQPRALQIVSPLELLAGSLPVLWLQKMTPNRVDHRQVQQRRAKSILNLWSQRPYRVEVRLWTWQPRLLQLMEASRLYQQLLLLLVLLFQHRRRLLQVCLLARRYPKQQARLGGPLKQVGVGSRISAAMISCSGPVDSGASKLRPMGLAFSGHLQINWRETITWSFARNALRSWRPTRSSSSPSLKEVTAAIFRS
mmetsp:Transcript_2933/g.3893  ORF Transcript_2933/g.3893 Transcript_2933/m.3893 type:complete len:213 (-) Transcript_2933:361-999(-)